ncbi:hypothetical protein AB0T83_16200 [Fluviibacterium sp. DFM31]|uniref:Uncharacterized protein n=1 Tax=Meridianimarinicoccus marinus TaxID=3231483 RepID=A0ABV3L9T3_9RHOB
MAVRIELDLDGAIRDGNAISAMDFPAYCRASTASTRPAYHRAVDMQQPIGCAKVAGYPGIEEIRACYASPVDKSAPINALHDFGDADRSYALQSPVVAGRD